MSKKHLISIYIVVALVIGFFVGRSLRTVDDKLPPYYGCNQIARWHADYLMREYGVNDGFNTNLENPRREFNQKASDLNSMILHICFTNPENVKPGLKEMIEEQSDL